MDVLREANKILGTQVRSRDELLVELTKRVAAKPKKKGGSHGERQERSSGHQPG